MNKQPSKQEQEVLEQLSESEWLRPMDIGARDSSHHSRTLNRLIEKGLVERVRRNTLANSFGSVNRGSFRYRKVRREEE